jgi:hypothetical protein
MGLQATRTASLNEGGEGPLGDQMPMASVPSFASTCKLTTLDPVPNEVAALVEASIAESTRRAYRSDLAISSPGAVAGGAGARGILPCRPGDGSARCLSSGASNTSLT